MGRILALLAVAALWALPAQADSVRGSIRLADKQLPLPAGEWIVAGSGVQELPHDPSGPFGVIRSIVLLQRKGEAVSAIAEYNTNDIAVSDGWDTHAACDAAAPEQRQVRYSSRLDLACWFVSETHTAGGPAAWQQALDYIGHEHLRLPDSMLTAAFVVSDRQDLVDARLHFDPAGFPPDSAEPLLRDWAARFAPEFERGIANQLDAAPLDGPVRSALLSVTPDLDARLLALEALQRSGTLTPAAALAQQQAALTERPLSAEAAAVSLDSWYYRISTPLINLLTAYGVTQSAPLALTIAAAEHVAHSFVYAATQSGWDRAVSQATRHQVPLPPILHIGEAARPGGTTS